MKSPRSGAKKHVREHRILVVEDNAQDHALIREWYETDGICFDMALDAETALDLLSKTEYSAIWVDLYLPGMNGRELIREIRRRHIPIKIIVISGTDSYADILDSYEGGADYFISKPYNKDYIRVLLHRALENTEFFKKHWAEIRERWIECFPKQRLVSEKNIIEETDAFLHNRIFECSPYYRVGLLLDRPKPAPRETPADPNDRRPEYLVALLTTVPTDAKYEQVASVIAEANHDFRREMAARLEPALNADIQGMKHDTLEQKKELGRWVNEELEPLGLAVQCPNTLKPAKLRATTGSSNWPDTGRFYFETVKNGKQTKSAFSGPLPVLTLMDANPLLGLQPPEVTSETPWQDEVGPKSSRSGRKRN